MSISTGKPLPDWVLTAAMRQLRTKWVHLDELFVGIFLATVPLAGRKPAWLPLAGWASAALLVLSMLVTHGNIDPVYYRGGLSALAVCAALIIAHVLTSEHALMARVIGSPPFVWLGRRSYAFYLFHGLILLAVRSFRMGTRSETAFVGMLLSLCLIDLSYRFVEQPIRALRRDRRRIIEA